MASEALRTPCNSLPPHRPSTSPGCVQRHIQPGSCCVLSLPTVFRLQSFRFGPEIAYVASLVLDLLKGERRQTLVGGAQEGNVQGLCEDRPLAIIARTNAGLFDEMARVANLASTTGEELFIGFAGVRTCAGVVFCRFVQ